MTRFIEVSIFLTSRESHLEIEPIPSFKALRTVLNQGFSVSSHLVHYILYTVCLFRMVHLMF